VFAVSLFSGAGGLDLGFSWAGWRAVLANDIKRDAAETYSRNFGIKVVPASSASAEDLPAFLLGSAEEIAWEALEPALEEPDALIGGPPCQDFSVVRGKADKRRGIEVRRGRLYLEFVRALKELRPKAFAFENVPGLRSANRGLAYKTILEDFQRAGYKIVFSDVVDFSKMGVPQMRRRLIIIGVREDLVGGLAELWRVRARTEALLKPRDLLAKYPLTPMEAFTGRRLDELEEEYRELMREWEGVWEEVGTERALRWKREVWDKLTFDVIEDYLKLNGIRPKDRKELEEALDLHEEVLKRLGYWRRPVCSEPLPDGTCAAPSDISTAERMRRIPPGENHEFVRGTEWEVEGRGMSLIYRRLHPLVPAPTVVAYGGGGTHGYHYERGRATLTLRERARLQTFPDSFLFSGTRAQIRAQIGEAVPPLGGERVALAILPALRHAVVH